MVDKGFNYNDRDRNHHNKFAKFANAWINSVMDQATYRTGFNPDMVPMFQAELIHLIEAGWSLQNTQRRTSILIKSLSGHLNLVKNSRSYSK